jgi:hypothetical protein
MASRPHRLRAFCRPSQRGHGTGGKGEEELQIGRWAAFQRAASGGWNTHPVGRASEDCWKSVRRCTRQAFDAAQDRECRDGAGAAECLGRTKVELRADALPPKWNDRRAALASEERAPCLHDRLAALDHRGPIVCRLDTAELVSER